MVKNRFAQENMKPSWSLERQATEAKARETYFRSRVRTPKLTVDSKDASTFVYRSMFLKFTSGAGDDTSADHLPFTVNVAAKALTLIPIASSGLLLPDSPTIPAGLARKAKGSGLKPTKASWYEGAATPTVKQTEWGTRTVRYAKADTAATQTFFSTPICINTGDFGPTEVAVKFKTIFSGTQKTTLLGSKNGRANLELEACASFFSINT